MKHLKNAMLALAMAISAIAAHAQTTDFTLDITGNISHATDASTHTYRFTRQDLLALPVKTIRTSSNWTPVSVWRGPTLKSVLEKAGAQGKSMRVYALDHYSHEIPVSDAEQYGVIVAYERDGKPLEEKGFGPLMLIYPRDALPDDANRKIIDSRFVWQTYKIVIE
ncbi:molybdopterin-dependent oxidoreductase [Paraburkholderia sp.]|uniref:molybdopterin-dependent oxidoreductase n=1 Tax=Paraburkholderia sp. TaxID=1926495 RepID=UPI003D6F39F3